MKPPNNAIILGITTDGKSFQIEGVATIEHMGNVQHVEGEEVHCVVLSNPVKEYRDAYGKLIKSIPLNIRRCLWCKFRLGHPRYFIDGEWQSVVSIHHLIGDASFTDGLCPDCHQIEMAKLRAMRGGH